MHKGKRANFCKKSTAGGKRFYRLYLQPTLFGDYIIERIYGNIRNKGPTGVKIIFFNDYKMAKKEFVKFYKKRLKRGYSLCCF